VHSDTAATVEARIVPASRQGWRLVVDETPRLLDTRFVRAELVRLRGPHPAVSIHALRVRDVPAPAARGRR
jgi:hypothetical protein